MVKNIASTLAVAALSATALAVATPAYANPSPTPSPSPSSSPAYQPKIASLEVGPNPVVVKRHDSTRVKVTVRTVDVKDVKISIQPAGYRSWDNGRSAATGGDPLTNRSPVRRTWDRTDTIDWKDPVGAWQIRVVALGLDNKEYTQYGSFVVKHDQWGGGKPSGPAKTSIVGFEATPKQVRKGKRFVLKGRLAIEGSGYRCSDDRSLDLDNIISKFGGDNRCGNKGQSWYGSNRPGGRDIDVYFQAKDSGRWRYVDTLETESDGTFASKFKAFRSGTWKVKFDGGRRLTGSEASTFVGVVGYRHW